MVTTTLIVLIAAVLYVLFYFTYGKVMERSVVRAQPGRPTPAVKYQDGVDFVPARPVVLFGHHFASIAGAAPIVGPAIAMAWGWLPGLLWVWLGNIFLGAIHDYLSLMASVRYDGKSIQWIAGRLIRERTGMLFEWFILFVLILVVAAFSAVLGKLFVAEPEVPTVFLLLIPLAMVLGYLLYRVKMNFHLATALALGFFVFFLFLGLKFPVRASYQFWMVFFLVYIVVAASLPVWLLLQPRDYLNAWLLWAGLAVGGVAFLVGFRHLSVPAFTMWSAPVIAKQPSPFWPLIPLIIGCGALSGFHSLVASGTTSKQLDNERSGLFIGFGAMFTEGFLSTLVIVAIGAFGLQVLGQAAQGWDRIAFGHNYVGAINAKGIGGPVGIFAKSFGLGIHTILGLPQRLMVLLAGLWVGAYAMTTLDTTNRIARFVIGELAEPLADRARGLYQFFRNRWVASLIPAGVGIWLAWGGAWTLLWPAFAGANQMLASIALLTSAAWATKVLKVTGWRRIAVTAPAFFLWITVTLALLWYLFVAVPSFGALKAWVLGVIVLTMLVLNFVLMYDFVQALRMPPTVREEPQITPGSS